MTVTFTVEAAGRTDVGLVRRRNEDAMYLGERLFAVADGLGGHVAGDVASTTAIEALRPYDRPVNPESLADTLGRAVSDVNGELRRRIARDRQLAGMGTTLVALLLAEPSAGPSGEPAAVLANLGDSRAYLQRTRDGRRETVQITEDHTYAHLVADAADVPRLPQKLARFLDGRIDGRSPDLTPIRLRSGDRLLLCSDGLSSPVPHDLIHATLATPGGPGEVADRLVRSALDRGGPDNVTVLVIDIGGGWSAR
jgi:serine/threonine protein phosphatase PrpC